MRVRVPFGGLAALEADELVPFERAVEAMDCVLDDGTARGRSGYRNAVTGPGTDIVESGYVQGIWRHQPSASTRRTVLVISGNIYFVTDPTDEESYGSVSLAASDVFGASDAISGAQLGRYLYLASDAYKPGTTTAYDLVRIDADGTVEHIVQLPKPSIPSAATSRTFSMVWFKDLTRTLLPSGTYVRETERTYGSYSAFYYDGAGGRSLNSDEGVRVTLTATTGLDWSDRSHIVVLASPARYNKSAQPVAVEIGTNSGTWERLGVMLDTAGSAGDYAPGVWIFDLSTLTDTTRAAVKYVRFINGGAGSQGCVFQIAGYFLIAASPGLGTIRYRTTYYDGNTDVESPPSDEQAVTITEPAASEFPAGIVPSLNGDNATSWHSGPIAPWHLPAWLVGNRDGQGVMPPIDVAGGTVTVTQAIHTDLQSAGTLRLWRYTRNGWRLVTSRTWGSATASVSIVDLYGDAVLSNEEWQAWGTHARCQAMVARDGRLAQAEGNRVYASSYLAANLDDATVPQFPEVPLDASDGWAFDVTPAPTETVQCMVNGDVLYIGTDGAVYAMESLQQNSAVSIIMRRGVVGRRAMAFVEDMCIWASYDGVYAVRGRVNAGSGERAVQELTAAVRRLYTDWLKPGPTTCFAYLARKLYVITDGRFLRFDFVTGTWTRGTWAHRPKHVVWWTDSSTAREHCWMLVDDIVGPYTQDFSENVLPSSIRDDTKEFVVLSGLHSLNVSSGRLNGTGFETAICYPSLVAARSELTARLTVCLPAKPFSYTCEGGLVLRGARYATNEAAMRGISVVMRRTYDRGSGQYAHRIAVRVHEAGRVIEQTSAAFTPSYSGNAHLPQRMSVACDSVDQVPRIRVWYSADTSDPNEALTPLITTTITHPAVPMTGFCGIWFANMNGGYADDLYAMAANVRLVRLQDGYYYDDDQPLPRWTYSTGFMRSEVKTKLGRVVADVTSRLDEPSEPVRITATRLMSARDDARRTVEVLPGAEGVEVERPLPSDISAYKWRIIVEASNSEAVRSLMAGLEPVQGAGG